MRRLLAGLIFVVACGGSDNAITAPTPPASIVITSASLNAQDVSLHLHNNGGSGDYYLEFWALAITPNGQPRVSQVAPVAVLASYDEGLVYRVVSGTVAVKVKSRPTNTAVYIQTDCKVFDTAANFCP